MSYQERINKAQQKVYEKAVATKILDLMDKLRLGNNQNDHRRWIWELLQNAKDAKNRERNKVDAVVDLQVSEKILAFSHNGQCFSPENITFLIEQVSTKERSDDNIEETTGKFGTGFLTTHLLSEVVEIHGIVKDDGLPYRKFCIHLDRSSTDLDGITSSLKRSLEQLEQIYKEDDYDGYNSNDFNTSFIYHLDESGIETALAGIEDLETCLPLALVFLPSIESVEVKHISSIYSVVDRKDVSEDGISMEICKVLKISSDKNTYFDFVVIHGSYSEIAFPVETIVDDSSISLKNFDDASVPCLFCDFPLVGSEKFGIPFVINSSHFCLTEPRDGVFLTDVNDNRIDFNKQIIQEAVDNFSRMIDYACHKQWKNLYCLAKLSKSSNYDAWLSMSWYESSLLSTLINKLYESPIVVTDSGEMVPLQEDNKIIADIPFDSREELREEIWKLVVGINFFAVPQYSDLHKWYQIIKNNIWDKNHRLTIELLSTYIVKKANSLDELSESFKIANPIVWLNKYFSLLNLAHEDCIQFLESKSFKIIPNQQGDLCLPSALMCDENIEDDIKQIGSQFVTNTNYYEILAHKSISITNLLPIKKQSDVVLEINQTLRSRNFDLEKKISACQALTCLFPADKSASIYPERNFIYKISQKVFADQVFERKFIDNWEPEIWEVSDRFQLKFIVQKIAGFENLLKMSKILDEDIDDIRDWLSKLVLFINDSDQKSLLESKDAIVPNQNGTLCQLDALFVEGEYIDEILKDISANLGIDFRNELIDSKFAECVNIPPSRQILQKDIASEIRDSIIPLLSDLKRSQHTQEIFNQLILWMDDNQETAKSIFLDLFENRHKLYDDKEVADNLRRVGELEEQVNNLTDKNEFLKDENARLKLEIEQLQSMNSSALSKQKQPVTDDVLITYGITTIEQLENIVSDPEFSRKYEIKGNDYDDFFSKLEYVTEIIKRAKKNVKDYLNRLEDYDCRNWYEPGMTYISGVLKMGKPVEIIVRPSDNKKIVFYYPEEKDVLSLIDSELWTDNGRSSPCQITLGMVLKIEGIDQISLP
jgi:regulator of replication initiation timing